VLLARQPYEAVREIAEGIAAEKQCLLFGMEDGRWKMEDIEGAMKSKGWPEFLKENALVALNALDLLGIEGDPKKLQELKIFGRFYPLTENLRIDVGHNPLAARAIAEAMESETVLIYNSLDDKDYREVLSILRPKLKRVELIPIETQRAATRQRIETVLEELEGPLAGSRTGLWGFTHFRVGPFIALVSNSEFDPFRHVSAISVLGG